ncbi:hypothetical protein [Granulicella sp. WH15]|uniref:hypothetical protein n=1 Tax=Granulicella sp. WH15 TaxID=2602070 RepID=UPI0021083324|nr:hypothetical protein [Granulicella sp. WH15]
MTSIVLVCAVLASLAAGVLIAYGVCVSLFELFRIHANQVRAARVSSVAPARVVEG